MQNLRTIRTQAMVLIGALVVQYLLGMYVNLFVPFPEHDTEGQLWTFAWSQPALAAHIILAFLIFFGSIVLCVRAVHRGNKIWAWCSFVGLLAIFAAGFSGSRFVPTQVGIFSYLMALSFIVAIASYSWGIALAKE